MQFTLALLLFTLSSLFLSSTARPIRVPRQINDFGSCESPEIQFALGLDGRKDPSFQAVNQGSFNHGSALGSGVITSFVCQQLKDKCKAPQETLDACAKGQADAAAVKGGGSADAFNAAFGIQTNFAATAV